MCPFVFVFVARTFNMKATLLAIFEAHCCIVHYGYHDVQSIIEFIQIAEQTLYPWKKQLPIFSTSYLLAATIVVSASVSLTI